MAKKLATFVSYLFHPLLFPTYSALIIAVFVPQLFAHLSAKIIQLSVIIVFIMTCLFPVFSLALMRRLELINSFRLENAQERIIPFIAIGSFYIWTFFYFRPSYHLTFANPLIANMLLGAVLAVFFSFILNLFKKISLHAMAAGSLLGLLLNISPYSLFDLQWLIIIALILGGIIGTARLILEAHENDEIWIGYLVGFIAQFAAFRIFPLIFQFFKSN